MFVVLLYNKHAGKPIGGSGHGINFFSPEDNTPGGFSITPAECQCLPSQRCCCTQPFCDNPFGSATKTTLFSKTFSILLRLSRGKFHELHPYTNPFSIHILHPNPFSGDFDLERTHAFLSNRFWVIFTISSPTVLPFKDLTQS